MELSQSAEATDQMLRFQGWGLRVTSWWKDGEVWERCIGSERAYGRENLNVKGHLPQEGEDECLSVHKVRGEKQHHES